MPASISLFDDRTARQASGSVKLYEHIVAFIMSLGFGSHCNPVHTLPNLRTSASYLNHSCICFQQRRITCYMTLPTGLAHHMCAVHVQQLPCLTANLLIRLVAGSTPSWCFPQRFLTSQPSRAWSAMASFWLRMARR